VTDLQAPMLAALAHVLSRGCGDPTGAHRATARCAKQSQALRSQRGLIWHPAQRRAGGARPGRARRR
jgi:hypothetical protein